MRTFGEIGPPPAIQEHVQRLLTVSHLCRSQYDWCSSNRVSLRRAAFMFEQMNLGIDA